MNMRIRMNDPPSHYDIMRCVIAATISTFPDKTEFKRDLDEQVSKLYQENSHPLLEKHRYRGFSGKNTPTFRHHPEDLVFVIINVYGGYAVGLSNWGLDYDYQVEKTGRNIGSMVLTGLDYISEHAKEVLGEKDFSHFAELGRQLKPRF